MGEHPDAESSSLAGGQGAIIRGEAAQPGAVLGPHPMARGERQVVVVRAFLPAAREAQIRLAPAQGLAAPSVPADVPMDLLHPAGLYAAFLPADLTAGDQPVRASSYTIAWRDDAGQLHVEHDPYAFPAQINDVDLYLFGEGTHQRPWEMLGAHPREVEGVRGVHFAVWAPNARAVALIGDHNGWDSRRHPMNARGGPGVWELFIPGLGPGALYKFAIRTADGQEVHKSDPYAVAAELRPATASIVADLSGYGWGDAEWMATRAARQAGDRPVSVYEVHLGSWRRSPEGGDRMLTYRELADQLVSYAVDMGYTHLELLPITEHPFDQSFGYQTTGYYAPTSRFGSPHDFMYFVDRCHQAGLGVLLDWVPSHFAREGHGLGIFDGAHLYEHADPRQGESAWGSYVFNLARHEVRAFLVGSALFWCDLYHLDGFRVDAVASMLYLDFGREPGGWAPNQYGGRENLEAIEFLRAFNTVLHEVHPGVLTCAEESTAWPGITHQVAEGGLGFDIKWNMGWMNDMLDYVERDPIYRSHHQNGLTFSFHYAFSEHYILPLSHDEVIHLKKALLAKMPGDTWQRLANLRLLYGYMYAHPGKKLLFMGGEFGQWNEWAYHRSLDWHLLQYDDHRQLQAYVRAVNGLYSGQPSLHEGDFSPAGFRWIDGGDAAHSVVAFLRYAAAPDDMTAVVANFTPLVRHRYRVGVPRPGRYVEVFNSDATEFGGSGVVNTQPLLAEETPSTGHPYSLTLTLPPLAILYLRPTAG